MKKEIKKIDDTKMRFDIELGGEALASKFKDVYDKISKEAKVKGFRPGKVPRDILQKHYSAQAHQQVANELIPDLLKKAAGEDGINIINIVKISDVDINTTALSFKAEVEIEPEVKLAKYRDIKVRWGEIKVSEDDISRYMDSLKEKKQAKDVDDDFVRGLGYPDRESLKESIRMQLYLQKENQMRAEVEQKIVDTLLKGCSLVAPQGLINRHLEELVSEAKMQLAMRGFSKEQVQEKDKGLRDELKERAQTQVKVYLIFKKIAEKENVPVDNQVTQRVMEFLLKVADWDVPSRIIT